MFELYASGLGYKRICAELTRLGCKNTHGTVEWKVDRIGRILRNATYKGFIGYNKSHSDGYLTQKRINHRDEEHIYVRGNFEPIVSESLWDHCAELRSKKSSCQRGEDGRTKKFGRKEPQSVWTSKLRCSCGSSFRRFLWHKNTNGTKTYGYECYRQKRTVSSQYLEKNRLDLSLTCHQKSIPFWHIDLMAYMVFEAVWKERKDAVLLACQMIEECAISDSRTSEATLTGLKQQLAKLQKQQEGLRGMCALGDISREEFLRDNQQIQEHIKQLEARIEDLSSASPVSPINMKKIRHTLNQWVDLAAPVIPDRLIDQFILQVIVVDDTTYNWTLNLSSNPTTGSISPSEIARRKYHESRSGGKLDPHLNSNITDPQEVFSFTVTEADARDYCRRIGLKFFAKKWQDKQVIISI